MNIKELIKRLRRSWQKLELNLTEEKTPFAMSEENIIQFLRDCNEAADSLEQMLAVYEAADDVHNAAQIGYVWAESKDHETLIDRLGNAIAAVEDE